jgi:uncharacterized protein YxjI
MARYKMRQRLISIGEDYDIEDQHGQPVYHVDGQIMHIRETFVMTNMRGDEVATIKQKLLALRESMTIERGGQTIATIRKAWIAPLRDKFAIEVPGKDMVAQGSILEHEYHIKRGFRTIAQISKRWFTLRDTYGIEIDDGEDDALILAIAVAIDEMAHDRDEDHQGHAHE